MTPRATALRASRRTGLLTKIETWDLADPCPPPAKRARTATAPERVKSFDGAKQFIAQLREAEAGGGEAEALGGEAGGGETAVEAKDTAPARIHETANGEHDPAT